VPDEQTIGLLSAVVVLRVALLVWASVVVAIDIRGVAPIRPVPAVVALGVLSAWTALYGWWVRRRPTMVVRTWVGIVDVALAASVAGIDHLVYEGPHPQTFASAWPLCAAVVAGIVHGTRVGAFAGACIGSAGAIGMAALRDGGLDGAWLAALGTIVLMTVSGAIAGMVTGLVRRAETTAARAEAREEVARQLHDGVLQTLAVVQRRSDDPELVGLAREQELDLRRFISDERPRSSQQLVAELRRTLAQAERRTSLRCELVVIDDPGTRPPETVEALCGAVHEAVTNAAKHSQAPRVVVCLDSVGTGAVSCTINDNGVGFDVESTPEGTGMTRSIRGRVEQVGGTVQVSSRPGEGCEIALRVP